MIAVLGLGWLALRAAEERGGAPERSMAVEPEVAPASVELTAAPAQPVAEEDRASSARSPAAAPVEGPSAEPAPTAAPSQLHVLLVDGSTNEPLSGLAGALRRASGDGGGWVADSRSDGWLRFEKVAAGEALSLQVLLDTNRGELAQRDVAPLLAGERRELRVELDAEALPSYGFRVRAHADGRALGGVRLREFHLRQGRAGRLLGATDGAGLVRLGTLAGPAALQLDAEDFAPGWVSLRRGAARDGSPTELVLARPASLTVRLESSGDADVAHRELVVYAGGWDLGLGDASYASGAVGDARWTTSAETDADGVAHFDALPSLHAFQGSVDSPLVRLDVGLRDHGGELLPQIGESLVLEPGEHRELVVRLGGDTRVTGRVVDQFGAPVPDRGLLLYRARDEPARTSAYLDPDEAYSTLVSDAAGRFEIEGVGTGRWELFLAELTRQDKRAMESYEPSEDVVPVGTVFDVDGSGRTVEVELVAPRGLLITGIALDASGVPIQSGFVFGFATRERHGVDTRLDADGRFEFGPLLEAEYTLSVTGPAGSGADPVRARPGDDVILQLPAMGGLRARLLGEPDPMPQAASYSWSRDLASGVPASIPFSSTTTPEFEVRATPEGSYVIAAWTDDGRFAYAANVEVVGDRATEEVPLRLEPGGRIRVRVSSADAKLAGAARLAVLRHSGHAVRSTYLRAADPEVLPGPLGPATAELWVDGELRASRDVVLVAGQVVDVEFGAP